MSNPNQARRVTAQIFFQGADISTSIRPYLLSATYTDKEADETDDLQLKLQDRDDIWLKKWLADAIDAAASSGSLSASSKTQASRPATSYKVTSKSGLNVRSGPSTSYGKYGALVCGAISKCDANVRKFLGPCLLPQVGVAIGLALAAG